MIFDVPFYHAVWPWVGLGLAIAAMFAVIFCGCVRTDTHTPRLSDPSIIGWFAFIGYLLHNVEEYGVDLQGRLYIFPQIFQSAISKVAGVDFVMPAAYFTAVNVAFAWFALGIAAFCGRRFPLVALAGGGMMLANVPVHAIPAVFSGYNPGLLTAIVIFIPLSLWTLFRFFGRSGLKIWALQLLLGFFTHAVLFISVRVYVSGHLSTGVLYAVQIANSALWLLLAFAIQFKFGKIWRENH